jgi:hypothetical protein
MVYLRKRQSKELGTVLSMILRVAYMYVCGELNTHTHTHTHTPFKPQIVPLLVFFYNTGGQQMERIAPVKNSEFLQEQFDGFCKCKLIIRPYTERATNDALYMCGYIMQRIHLAT